MDDRFKYFVTGGAGFIGSHLTDRLMQMGGGVVVYDDLSSGREEWLEPYKGRHDFQFVKAGLLNLKTLREAMQGCEVVWHLGANTDIPRGNRDVYLDLNNGIVATFNVLEAMRGLGITKILFTSSSTVYGEIGRRPTPEDAGPLLPISLYGAGKLAAEGLISAFCHLFGIQAWIFRFGNVMGSRMGHGVVVDFIRKLRENPRGLKILGDGNQEKNYFMIEDCIDGMLCAFERCDDQCNVFNLGCESTVTVKEIARIVVQEMGLKDVRFRFAGGARGWPGDVPKVFYDITKMKKLGWQPRYTSAEAVRITTRRLLGKEG